MFSSFLQCCNSRDDASTEFQVVQLTSDVMDLDLAQPVHLLTTQDPFDVTVTPRRHIEAEGGRGFPATARQRNLKDRIVLPTMRRYPIPHSCSSEDSEEWRRQELLKVYQEFVLDLHKGIHMTQLTSDQDYSDIHCQIREDLQTLNIDQGSGCIIEFPLTAVSKVYRIVKNDGKWYNANSLSGPAALPSLSNAEHIVVVEFMRRKLAFVFSEVKAAQSFLMCMELLIRRAQECRYDKNSDAGQKTGTRQISHVFSRQSLSDRERDSRRLNDIDSASRMCRLQVCQQSEVV